MTPNRHQGRTVLVTGAASGIGASISRQYAQEGAVVAIVDVNAQALEVHAKSLQALGARVAWATADVSDFAQCESALASLTSALDSEIDTLINNAGISPKVNGKPANFWEMDPAEWMKVVGVNLHGAFNWSRLVTPAMVQRRFGSIVNMSSVAAKFFVDFTAAHYGTTKAALIGLTRDLAGELGPYGITVNALAPGFFPSKMTQATLEKIGEDIKSRTPLRRLGDDEDLKGAAVLFCSDAGKHITGQILAVDGGMTAV